MKTRRATAAVNASPCPNCAAPIRAPAATRSRRVQCPQCRAVVVLEPAPGAGKTAILSPPPPPVNDECAADDWGWIDVEICGPMRPHYPDYGRHKRTVRVHNQLAAEQRWSYTTPFEGRFGQ